jgi:hypothetical protein
MNNWIKKIIIPLLIASGLIWIILYSLIKIAEPYKRERIQKERMIKKLPSDEELKSIEL